MTNPLSVTRSSLERTHLLQTPDTFVRTPMPGLLNGLAVVHAAPALGAAFVQYTVELAEGGTLAGAEQQRFIYVLEGTAQIASSHMLRPGSFAYLPPRDTSVLRATSALRAAVIEKRYEALADDEPQLPTLAGHEEDVEAVALHGDAGVLVRSLLPLSQQFDFAVNTMTYAAGAALSQVEIHYMEHGLLMLEGAGPYRLGKTFYDVEAGDFIWMAPFCPQWFQASAAGPAKYLIYKNFNRKPAL